MLSVSPPSHWMQSLGLLGGLVGAAWMALRLERDEREAVKIDPQVIERGWERLPEWYKSRRKSVKWLRHWALIGVRGERMRRKAQ